LPDRKYRIAAVPLVPQGGAGRVFKEPRERESRAYSAAAM
jgi:hypothetical protein